jgi:gliding motility-associated-like protein
MRTVSTITCLLVLSTAAWCQSVKLAWANALPGNSYDVCRAIAIDNESNVYAAGYFSTTVDFDPGAGTYNLSSASAEDIFISKYDSTGKLLWAKRIGDFRYQAVFDITLDAAKNIYVSGIFFGSTDFDTGPGTAILNSAGNEDIFLCKYSNSGDLVWAKSFGGPTNDYCNSIMLDNDGNIYMNGYFENTADFDPGTGVYNLVSNGGADIFVCKLDMNGSLRWARSVGGVSGDGAYMIGLDDQNNVYSTGFFWNSVDFDPGAGVFNLNADGFGDGYVLKLDAGGNFVKAVKMGGNSRVRNTALKIDRTGYIYITGHFDGTADFDPGSGSASLVSPIDDDDIFIGKYDLDLNLAWIKQIAGPSYQRVFAIETDILDNIYLTGHYHGNADFDPGPGEKILTATNDPDMFVLKMSPAGNFIWVSKATGPYYISGYTLQVDRGFNIYVGGTFEGTIDFDEGPEEAIRSSAGQSEIFIKKLRQCPANAATQTMNVTTCKAYVLNNKTYNTSGTYTHLVLNSAGCDSIIITLNLTISRIINSVNANICQGEFYFAGGRMQNRAGIYYDTLQTAAGCDSVVITDLSVKEKPGPVLGNDRNLCAGQSITLDPGSFNSYLWQDGSTVPTYRVNSPGMYTVTVTNEFNCKTSARVNIRDIVTIPSGFLPADQDLCNGHVLKINVPGYYSYSWSTGETTAAVDIRSAGLYYLTVTSYDNCIGTDTINLQPVNCIPIGIPNAFTPNNDGKNDEFKPGINVEIRDYEMSIYNRVGQLLFKTKDPGQGWDGRFKGQQQSSDNYIYWIAFKNIEGKQFEYRGNIILLR